MFFSSDSASPGAGQRRAIATRTVLADFSRDRRRKGRIVAPPLCAAAPRALILEEGAARNLPVPIALSASRHWSPKPFVLRARGACG